MPLWKNTQHAFVAGQLDSLVMGRQDLDKYFKGATKLKNFVVRRQGCISKRRGTDLAADLDGILGVRHDLTPIVAEKIRLVPVTNGDEGRYVILAGGMAFVANRDGILTSDRRHIRKIPEYVAEDADGNPIRIGGKDVRRSKTTPVDVIHRIGSGNYEVTRFATLQDAFDAAVDGDTVRLHNDYFLDESESSGRIRIRSEKFTPEDGVNSTFAFTSGSWTMKRGATTYTANKSGRYIPTLTFDIGTITATRRWSYETSHSNRSFTLGWASSKWKLTAVDSAKVNGTAADLEVVFTIDGQQITATRTDEDSEWTFDDGNAWSMEFASSKWTASRTVGTASSATSTIGADSFTVTLDGETVTATSSWTFSETGWSVEYVSSKFKFSKENYIAMSYTGTYDQSTFSVAKRVRCNRQQKHIKFDLYGYKITLFQRVDITISTAKVGVTFMTSRPGAKMWCISNSNCGFIRRETQDATCGTADYIHFEDGIEWRMIGGQANYSFTLNNFSEITFNGGTFIDQSKNPSCMGHLISASNVPQTTFNGGTFNAGLSSGNLYILNWTEGNVTVNGGEFISHRTGSESYIFYGSYGTCTMSINGGRFTCVDRSKFIKANTYATGPFADNQYIKVYRGEFSFSEMYDKGSGTWKDITAFAPYTTVQNTTYQNAEGYYGVKQPGEEDYCYTATDFNVYPYRICIPYADQDLTNLCIRQSGDTLFIAHRSYPPAKIYFDANGLAYFEELEFDNTSVNPPEITDATMQGQDPVETDWPPEFPIMNTDGSFDTSNVPTWLTKSDQSGASKTRVITVDGNVKNDWSVAVGYWGDTWVLKDQQL